MNWHTGDQVVCISPGPWHMMDCTIMSELYPKKWDGPSIPKGALVHETDLPGVGLVVAEPHEFRKRPPKESKTASWAKIAKLCGWKPKVKEVVT